MNNDTVTLKFTANTASLDKGFKDAQAGAANLSESLHRTGQEAKASRELLRGAGSAANVLGGELGQTAFQAQLGLQAVRELSHGMSILTARAREASAAQLALRGGLIALGAAAVVGAVSLEGPINQTSTWRKGLSDLNYAVATNIHFVTQGVPVLGWLTGKYQANADAASQAAHANYDLAAGIKAAADAAAANGLGVGGFADDPDGMAFSAGMLDGSNAQSAQFMANLQDDADAAASRSAKRAVRGGGGGGGGGVSAAIQAEKDRATAKLASWQSVISAARNVSQQVMAALNPKLDASNGGPGTSNPNGGVIGNLRVQLRQTEDLARDMKRLTKQGLNKDLLSQLAAGGLDSLPAANQLLATPQGVARANALSASIKASGAGVATQAGLLASQQKQTINVKVDVTGGESELKKLIRKWVRVDGGGDVQLALGKGR